MLEKINELETQIHNLCAILDHVGAYIFTKDKKGNYTYANKLVCELFGKSLSQIIGTSDEEYFDLQEFHELKTNDKIVLDTGTKIEREEINFIKASGEKRVYWTVKEPLLDSKGNVIGLCGISTDITERKNMEKKLEETNDLIHAVLDNAPLYVYVKDRELTYLYANRVTAELFGLSREQLIGRKDSNFLSSEAAKHFNNMDLKVFESGDKQEGEEVFISRDGIARHYWSIKIPLYSDEKINALVGISYDITEHLVLKNKLLKQNEELYKANEQKNRILSIAAHDLRNPLGSINGVTKILLEELSGENKNLINLIFETSTGMLELLNNLLDVTTIESGKMTLTKVRIDYISIIKQRISLCEYYANKKNIVIQSNFFRDEFYILLDKGKIEQVIDNLLSNAVKFSHNNTSIRINIYKENNLLLTEIIDEGQGIPEKDLSKIFHYFNKSSVLPTGNESSHGLGLAIVKSIIEGHEGKVFIESKVNQGTKFRFTLPCPI
ncbi:MAG: PAS domain-containing sensor histidine kinase [Leptospiraceae bacterium]|nr:PAS domain-containing sensor histidine kinase [Leptospiraceae bacterium]MCP5502169.1 PAS domain-containing sensor histidine kinase [Leptospiraceae bacterium]